MNDNNEPNLYEEFEDDIPYVEGSSAAVAAFDALVLYLDHDDADTGNDEVRTYHDALGEWHRDHKDRPFPLGLALLDLAGHFAGIARITLGEEKWQQYLETERDRLIAQDILTSAAYADQMGDDEDDGTEE